MCVTIDQHGLFYERSGIMESLRGYLLSVTVVAMCCGILSSLTGKKGLTGSTVKFLCGIVMLLVVIGPLVNIEIGS